MLDTIADQAECPAAHLRTPAATKLNVGCGSDYREGWWNIDGNDQLPRVDQVVNVVPGALAAEYDADRFSHLLAKDFLEHHHHWEAVQLLRDFYFILKPGGTLELYLPDLEVILNDSEKSIREKVTWLYGGQDIVQPWETDSPSLPRKTYPQYFCHRFGWTRETLRAELASQGFVDVRFENSGWNMHVLAIKRSRPRLSH